MRPLLVPLLVASLSAVRALPAQEPAPWNDERTRSLVRAAIDRRALQLADTGLLDYTARAHGYVTFLAQLGEGFRLPPKVIKSDELMVEVYWGAPDRSKQRVIGRRDTLLLPTDINYHRDHLAVVQGNFPAIIRLGDGDEVRDVPHPLSEAGLATYDYRITDSLAIRTSTSAIDVMMVSVRPKDDRTAAAVGAVYLDRESAGVVRMSLSFPRAALRDPELEDVSVILENGLVEGRYWLPRRQEIEIRRTASWMDFPARGIIRGRWEICCIEANLGLPPATFTGPEIVHAPRAQQQAFPFDGAILENLPEDVRALDDAEVRRVREEARELVRAASLARARTTSPSARSISDLARVNRAEGLALGGGIRQRLGRGFSLAARGRYGTADSRAKGFGELEWRAPGGWSLAVGGYDDLIQVGDVPEASGLVASIAAQEFGTDRTDPIGAVGLFARAQARLGRHGVEFGIERRNDRPLMLEARPSSGRYEPLLPAARASSWRATLGWSIARDPTDDGRDWRLTGRLAGTRARLAAASETHDYLRASIDAGARWPVGTAALEVRTVGAGLIGDVSGIPLQDAIFLGGPVTGPGYRFHSLTGRAGVSQRIELQQRIPFVDLSLGRFGRVPSSLTLAPYVHGAWVDDDIGVRPSVGLGIIGFFDLLRVDVARTVRGSDWLFSLDLTRDLWPVL